MNAAFGYPPGPRRPSLWNRVVTAAVAAGLTAGLALAAAPQAAADVLTLRAAPGPSWGPGTPFGTSCTYLLVATVDSPEPVTFYDFAPASAFDPADYIHPVDGVAVTRWTPVNPGAHRIIAHQIAGAATAIEVQVGTGIDTGSACIVPFGGRAGYRSLVLGAPGR